MTVYVDNARIRYGRMLMCHMVADSEAELHLMAQCIGIKRRWYHRGHYNICQRKRAEALACGAKEAGRRFVARLRRKIEQAPAIPASFPRGQSTPQGQGLIHSESYPLSAFSTASEGTQ